MNWIGGARQRVSLQGEKKLQKEFFERQKLKKHNLHDMPHSRKHSKRAISQDIAALQTVNKFSPNFSHLGVDGGQVRKVDLKGYKSTVVKENRVQEIELPHSPITIPSSLHLSDSRNKKVEKPKWEDLFKEKTKKHEPKSLFSYHVKQNEVPVKKRPQTCLSEYNSANSTVVPKVSNKKLKLPSDDWRVSSQTVERKTTADKDIFQAPAQMSNPWASEDFQMTPLDRYDAKYDDMLPWRENCDFNPKFSKENKNSKVLHHELFKPNHMSKKLHDYNVPNFSPESYLAKKTQSSRLNPIKPSNTYLEENSFRKSQRAVDQSNLIAEKNYSKSMEVLQNHLNHSSELDSFDSDYSFHSAQKADMFRHNYSWNQGHGTSGMPTNHHMKSGKCDESYSAYEPDSESTPVHKLLKHSKRTDSHPTLAEIKNDFIRKHGDMKSSLEEHHYKMQPRKLGNIPNESPWFRFHSSKYHDRNQIIAEDETPSHKNPPSFFNNNQSARKSLTPLFNSTQQMTALTPNEQSFVKMLSQDQRVMTSFDDESSIGLRDSETPNIRDEKIKRKKSAAKSKEMDEVLAEMSQLQQESDRDNIDNRSPVSPAMESPMLNESTNGTVDSKAQSVDESVLKNNSHLDHNHDSTSKDVSEYNPASKDLSEYNPASKDVSEYNHASTDVSENNHASTDVSEYNRASKENVTDNIDTHLTTNGEYNHTSEEYLSEKRKTGTATLCHSPILLPDSFEAIPDVTDKVIGNGNTFQDSKQDLEMRNDLKDGKRNSTFCPESFNLQVDTRKSSRYAVTDIRTQSDICSSEQNLKPYTSVPHQDSNAEIALTQSDNSLHLDVHVDMTTQPKTSTIDRPTSCHVHSQSDHISLKGQVHQATQTEVLTADIALSPICKNSNSISVGTQWPSLECYSPRFTQGCVELCRDENDGTQLQTYCNLKDIEKFSTESLSSTQDSLISDSSSSQPQTFYSLRSRQKCLQS